MGIILPQPEKKQDKVEIASYEQCKNMTPEEKLRITRNLVMTSTRGSLEKMREIIDNEIRLSDIAIDEGQEEDDRNE